MDFHRYCGPSFFKDSAMSKPYDFIEPSEEDPVWVPFEKWLVRYNAAILKRDTKRKK